jgi:glycosyltransferase involved in cell wall biosynthesis
VQRGVEKLASSQSRDDDGDPAHGLTAIRRMFLSSGGLRTAAWTSRLVGTTNLSWAPRGSIASTMRGYGTNMRIAHVAPHGERPGSGVLTVLVELTAALARRGHLVDLWQLHTWGSEGYGSQIGVLKDSGVDLISMNGGTPWRLAREARQATRARARELVHLHGAFNLSNTVVSRSISVPYVFSPHSGYDPISLRRTRRRKRLFSAIFERRTLAGAALITALTEVERAQIGAFGLKERIVVIPNGVSLPEAGFDRATSRSELELDPSAPIALFVGRLDVEHKGLDLFLRGIAGTDDWHAVLVGPDHRGGQAQLEALAAELGIESRIHFRGVFESRALDEAFAAADIFVLMSRWEGMPMSLLESLAHATPVVVSPTVESVLAVERAGAGWVSTAAELGSVLSMIAADQSRRDHAASAALDLAKTYDWDRVAECYEAAYASIFD